MRARTQFPALRKALAEKLTEHPKCDCGQLIPVRDWRVHRGTCEVIRQQREEKAAKSDGP